MASNEFGPLLRQLRKSRGMTIAQLADLLGVSVPYVSDVERSNRRAFSGATLVALEAALQLHPREVKQVQAAALRDRGAVEIASSRQEVLVVAALFGGRCDELSNGQLERIQAVLDEVNNG